MESEKASAAENNYWKGRDTPEDDEQLFGNPPLGDESYFDLIQEFRKLHLDESFNDRLLAQLDHANRRPTILRKVWWKYAAAAVVMLAVGGGIWKQAYVEQAVLMSAEQVEMEKAKQALLLMSQKLNEGMEYTYTLGALDEAINTITKDD